MGAEAYPIVREARVINTSDPEKLGRVQLKVYPELTAIEDGECPWAFPTSGGIHGKSFEVPLVGQLITCIVWNKFWNELSFLPFTITKPTEHLFDNWKSQIQPKISDMPLSPEEEHLVVEQFDDDFSIFHDTKNNQHGFLHPSGTFITINKDGDIWVQSVKKLKYHSKDDTISVVLDSETGDVELTSKGNICNNIEQNTEQVYKGNWELKVNGNASITVDGSTTISSPIVEITGGQLVTRGNVAPNMGPFCALPNCLFTGTIHGGTTVTGT